MAIRVTLDTVAQPVQFCSMIGLASRRAGIGRPIQRGKRFIELTGLNVGLCD